MDSIEEIKPLSAAQNLVKLIKQLVVERQYDGVALLFTSATEAQRNLESLKEVSTEVLHEVCLEQLNDNNYEQNMPLYNCAEELLLLVAAHGPAEELLLELLEMVETEKSDNVFTSTLKALQAVLFRLLDNKPRAFEWSLNSIQSRIAEYPTPAYLSDGYDLKHQRLLEQDEEVQRVLMSYITVGLFYEPLLSKLNKMAHGKIFRPDGIDSRNVLCCFLVQLLGRPLALLDLCTSDTQQTNTYTVQCARSITKSITECMGDPLYLLSYVEQRVRWKPRLDASKGVYEMSSNNIFLIDEKLPLVGLAIYYYMVLVEGVTVECVPKVYSPLYIFESGLYLATELFSQAEPALHYRGLLLGKRLVEQLQQHLIPAVQLELSVHKFFCHELCNIVGYSPQTHLRQNGVQLLRAYILQFDNEGKYLILKNLLRSIHHTGIAGYLAVIYKDLVANALLQTDTPLPNFYSGADFRSIFLHNICHLPNGAETDLIDYADKLISSLNALRFFVLKDCDNRTGIWNFIDEVKKEFMTPLRQGLDMSIAHYASELKNVEQGLDVETDEEMRERMKLLDVNVANADSNVKKTPIDLELDRQRKMNILNQHLCALDLIRSLLARATECVESPERHNCEVKN